VAEHGELAEEEVLFGCGVFMESLGVEVEHLLVGGLEDGGIPEIGLFPQGVFVD
jgi:hypothetical protein